MFTNTYQHTDLKIHDEDAVEVDEKWYVYGAEQRSLSTFPLGEIGYQS